MTLAVCVYCGGNKFGALSDCEFCGRTPEGVEGVAKSVVLSDHHLNEKGMSLVAQMIQGGKDPFLLPQMQEKYETFRSLVSDEDGELSFAAVQNWSKNQTDGDSGSHEGAEDSTTKELQHFLNVALPEYARLKRKAISRNAEQEIAQFGNDASNAHEILSRFISNWDGYITAIKAHRYKTREVKELNERILTTAEKTLDAIIEITHGLADFMDSQGKKSFNQSCGRGYRLLNSASVEAANARKAIHAVLQNLNGKYNPAILRDIFVSCKSSSDAPIVSSTATAKSSDPSLTNTFWTLVLTGIALVGLYVILIAVPDAAKNFFPTRPASSSSVSAPNVLTGEQKQAAKDYVASKLKGSANNPSRFEIVEMGEPTLYTTPQGERLVSVSVKYRAENGLGALRLEERSYTILENGLVEPGAAWEVIGRTAKFKQEHSSLFKQ